MAGRLDMVLANDLQKVGRVIGTLESFSVDERTMLQQGLRFCSAIDELTTNILSHRLAGLFGGVITLAVEQINGVLYAEVTDNGPQFDPLVSEANAPSGFIEEVKVGGLGITLVKAVMDRLDCSHDGGFNRLNLEMKRQAA